MAAPIDVSIVAYGSDELIGGCIGSMSSSPEVGRIVVVDHGDGRSADLAAALGAVVVRDPSNPGFGAGHNAAARRGESPFLLLLNPDARMEPGALGAGLAALEERPEVAAVQGIVRGEASGAPERSSGVELGPLHLLGRAVDARRLLRFRMVRAVVGASGALHDQVERVPSAATDVASLAATAVLIRREAFESVGGFDERYFLYGEDLDLCRRLRGAGWSLVTLPVPWARHWSGASAEGWWDRELRWWEGTLQLAAQWWSAPRFAAAMVAAAMMGTRMTVARPDGWRRAGRSLVGRPLRLRRRGPRAGVDVTRC